MMNDAPTIWINAGETSGDLHGGLLAQALYELRPGTSIIGMAGPAMRAAGVRDVLRSEDLSVMGFTEVLGHLPKILGLLRSIRQELKTRRPDVIVVIDAPDFNFRVIRIARELGIPVVYYISPKIWAWRESRVNFIRKNVHRLISILPFEIDFYARHGMQIDYVGHPLLDAIRTPEVMQIQPRPNRVGILPGSRRREITSLLPIFARTATLLATTDPDLEFVLPVAPGMSRDLLLQHWTSSTPVTFMESTDRYATMRSCRAILAASGTVTLETALLGVPTAVAYRFSTLTYMLARMLVRVPYMSLPNLIQGRLLFPEFLQGEVRPDVLAETLRHWIADTPERDRILAGMAELPAQLGGGNAISRAAALVLETAAAVR